MEKTPYDIFCEEVVANLSENYYKTNEKWITEYDGSFNKLLVKYFNLNFNASTTAALIQRNHLNNDGE